MTNSILPNQTSSYYPVAANRSEPGSTSNVPTEDSLAQIEPGSSGPRIPQRNSRQIELLAKFDATSQASASQSNNIDKYRKASINYSLVVEEHFEKDGVRNIEGGICQGISLIWTRLHQANPSATAANRMNLLSSEAAVTHAIITQRLHDSEFADVGLPIRTSFDNPELTTHAMHSTALDTYFFRTKNEDDVKLGKKPRYYQDDIKFGKLLNKKPGYYAVCVSLRSVAPGDSRVFADHVISVYSEGKCKRPLTIFDSNIGECQAPEQEFHSFLEEMSNFYQAKDGMEIWEISRVKKLKFTDDIRNTPLAHLVGE